MVQTVKLSELPLQADEVWSNRNADEIADFKISRLLQLFRETGDLSSLNTELINHAENFEEELWLSHLRANAVRAFEWSNQSSVLEIGCQAGAITRYLAEQNLYIDAVETNRALAQAAAYRTSEFSNVRIIDEPFYQLDFESKHYDVIVLTGITDYALAMLDRIGISYVEALEEFLSRCMNLLTPQGKILLSVDNNQGFKYAFGAIDERTLKPYWGYQYGKSPDQVQTLNLVQWRELLQRLGFASINEHYLWPDYRFTKVLLGQNYVNKNEFAFQHLEGVPSVDYHHPLEIGVSEYLLYQTLSNNGRLGEVANSILFVLSNEQSEQTDVLDFAHFPDYQRKPEYSSIVKKLSSESKVRRTNLVKNLTQAEIEKQNLESESFISGVQLSTLWMRSILHEPQGIQFEQYLRDYFDYLKKLEAGVYEGFNIDAVANNIVIDEQGDYQLIDREWQLLDDKDELDAPFVFYRALVQFSMRNDLIYHQFKWIHALSTLTDFFIYCFKAVGIDPKMNDLEDMRVRDLEFSKLVLKQTRAYELSDPFGHIVAAVKAITFVAWRFTDQYDYEASQRVICNPEAGHESQQLIFRLPDLEKSIACFRFFPFQHLKSQIAGYFSIDSIALNAVDANGQKRKLWSLDSSDQVNQANLHQGVFYASEQEDSVFMFNNNDTFLEFELPDYILEKAEVMQIEIGFRLKQSHDYELARKRYALAERIFNEKQILREDEFKALNKEFKKVKEELTEVQASRVWRLLAAYRDTFKISGYPQKNFLGKLGQLINRYKRSKDK